MVFNKKLFIGLAAVCIVLVVFAVVGKKKGWIGRGKEIQVTTTEVQRRTIIETVTASGKIYPETEVKISPDVSGEIIDLKFEEGDSVKKGDLILKIQPDIYLSAVDRSEATLNQARANLANAKARLAQAEAQYEIGLLSFNRNKKLHEEGVLSDADYENAQASFRAVEGEFKAAKESVKASEYSVKSAEAALKEAKDNLLKTNIHAPMSGIISTLLVEQGERVVGTMQMPGTEMLTVADLNNMEVRVDVSENDILRVSIGDTADIEVDAYLNRKFKGLVTHIASSAVVEDQLTSEQVTNFTVKIKILHGSYKDLLHQDQHPFKPGMSASVDIQTDKRRGTLSVPIQAVTIRETEENKPEQVVTEIVYLYESNQAKEQEVVTGIQDAQYIEIKEGLEEGQEIISGPYRAVSRLLNDGAYVERVTEEELKK